MSETRERIAMHIRAHPGVHFNAVVRALDVAPGQLQHHLKTLLGGDRFVAEHRYGRTHYYPAEVDAWDRRALALLRRETARDVVAVVLDAGTARPDRVAEALGIARSTVAWHVDRLVDAGLLTKDRGHGNRVVLRVARRDDVVALLRDADPTLLGRLVDRYTRLVDQLLTE